MREYRQALAYASERNLSYRRRITAGSPLDQCLINGWPHLILDGARSSGARNLGESTIFR
jgi:hypothetical protein